MKFNPDNPFFQFMNSLAAFIGLNVIFLITCLPIFTIEPAFAKVFMILLGFSFMAYCNSMLLVKVFKDYEEEPAIETI